MVKCKKKMIQTLPECEGECIILPEIIYEKSIQCIPQDINALCYHKNVEVLHTCDCGMHSRQKLMNNNQYVRQEYISQNITPYPSVQPQTTQRYPSQQYTNSCCFHPCHDKCTKTCYDNIYKPPEMLEKFRYPAVFHKTSVHVLFVQEGEKTAEKESVNVELFLQGMFL
ncbi:hypothetical protein HHI36_011633 [Cryptolaemus montrouzieri]|uniref:Uncharacterized protein n=1 Tax=Cryptolaemus montrouzieri TaxID=559131 RepID=A0ABD2MM91_9CUCU